MPLQPLEDLLINKGDTAPSPLREEIRPILVPARIMAIHVSQAEMECEKCRKTEIVREIDRTLEMQKLALQVMDTGTLAEEIRIISSDPKANRRAEMVHR
jgi:hypothetical protein